MLRSIICVCFLSLCVVSPVHAQLQSQSQSMSFEECRAYLDRLIETLGISPLDLVPIVRTSIMMVTRICTSDGSVLHTCSKPDRKMVMTKSPHRYGCQQ